MANNFDKTLLKPLAERDNETLEQADPIYLEHKLHEILENRKIILSQSRFDLE
jgi:hypothetical protein